VKFPENGISIFCSNILSLRRPSRETKMSPKRFYRHRWLLFSLLLLFAARTRRPTTTMTLGGRLHKRTNVFADTNAVIPSKASGSGIVGPRCAARRPHLECRSSPVPCREARPRRDHIERRSGRGPHGSETANNTKS